MHLRPAKYLPAAKFEGQSGELYGSLARSSSSQRQPPRQPKSSLSASSTSMASLFDGTNGTNNNNQLTANARQFHSPGANSIANEKLYAGHSNSNNNILLYTGSQQQSSDLLASNGSYGKVRTQPPLPNQSGGIMRAQANNTQNYNSNSIMNFCKHDKMKLMELAIINLVELSTMAADKGNTELALEKAKEALAAFNALKVTWMVQDKDRATANKVAASNPNRGNSNLDTLNGGKESVERPAKGTAPMTTGASLFELSLMVDSNLASQLANNGHFEESIELYTQLCKLAGGSAGLGATATAAAAAMSSRHLQPEARFLLYRFGLNIGNLYYKMGEYQRALKYYRLTLDRLSSSSGYGNLRVKIMHNITLALIAMGQFSDATTSLNLLLSDNLTNESSGSPGLLTHNSNHHEFGLNLLVCQHQQADLNSMMATLKALSKVTICQQYERVFDLDNETSQLVCRTTKQGNDPNDGLQSGSSSSSNNVTTISVSGVGQNLTSVRNNGWQQRYEGHDRTDIHEDESRKVGMMFDEDEAIGYGQSNVADRTKVGSSLFVGVGRQQQHGSYRASSETMTSGRLLADSIETLTSLRDSNPDSNLESDQLGGNSKQIIGRETGTASGQRAIGGSLSEIDHNRQVSNQQESSAPWELVRRRITKLPAADKSRQVMRLIQEDRLEKLICDKYNQISRSLVMGCNLMMDLDNCLTAKLSEQTGSARPTSAFEFCLKLLATSDSYKALVFELKANVVSGMLMKKYKLDEAIATLKELGSEQQADQQKFSHKDGANRSTVKSMTGNKYNNLTNKSTPMIHKSSMVATNCSLLNLLQFNTKKALEFGDQALKLDKFNVQALINLANSHYMLNDLEMAETLYERALVISPTNWEANYNLALLNRKLGRHYNELRESIKSILIKYRQCFSSLIWHRMSLMVVQSALIYHQSGLKQQSFSIINDLLSSQKQAPEVLLLASRLIDDTSPNSGDSIVRPSAMSILQQANMDHPYHIPVSERLIAIQIQNFNYDQARALLCNCIINRPDLVKWYQMLAECYRRAADYNKAIATYKIAVEAFPQDTGCLKALVKLTDELGLTEERKIFSNKLEETLRRFDLQFGTVDVDARPN